MHVTHDVLVSLNRLCTQHQSVPQLPARTIAGPGQDLLQPFCHGRGLVKGGIVGSVFFRGFGSSSFDDPVDGLEKLGLL